MAETRPGGLYRTAEGKDGKFVDSEGKEVEKPKAAVKEMKQAKEAAAEGRTGTPAPLSSDELAEKSKEELAALAAERGVTVTREDERDDLEPTRADYLKALGG